MRALISFLLLASTALPAEIIPPYQATKHVGEYETVCGFVAGERTEFSLPGEPTFLFLDLPYPQQVFTIVIERKNRRFIKKLPVVYQHACASGNIVELYKIGPQIIIHTSNQLSR
jgi:hypothetical protein